jgi:hypothetical protein
MRKLEWEHCARTIKSSNDATREAFTSIDEGHCCSACDELFTCCTVLWVCFVESAATSVIVRQSQPCPLLNSFFVTPFTLQSLTPLAPTHALEHRLESPFVYCALFRFLRWQHARPDGWFGFAGKGQNHRRYPNDGGGPAALQAARH